MKGLRQCFGEHKRLELPRKFYHAEEESLRMIDLSMKKIIDDENTELDFFKNQIDQTLHNVSNNHQNDSF